MNQCYGCTTCKSADKPLEGFIRSLPVETSHHRVEGQSTKCGFGLQGVCCRLCSNGPCRITPEAPRGICGANADTIVTRNFLRAVASGSGCYIHIVENTALNLKKTAQIRGELKGLKSLDHLAELFGITDEDIYVKAEKVADSVLADLYNPEYVSAELIEKIAYAPRIKRWKELGIMPGGAKGFKLVGCTCVGQDLQLRGAHYTEVFDGHAGNNYTSEAILATGAIDAVLSEFNCTLPGIEPICDELKIKQICLDDVAKKANAELMPFEFEHRAEQSDLIIDKIVEAYKERRGCVPLNLMEEHGNDHTLTGVSEGSLKSFLGGKWTPLIELLAAGEIKGIAGVVGCSNLTAGGHDVLSVELTKELISRDILVLTAGCSSGGIENCGLMTPEAAELAGPRLRAVCQKLNIPPVLNFGPCLAIGRLEIVATEIAAELGVDLPQLPLVLSAAQWLEEQALADGCFGLALGLPLHLGLPPFVTGSKTAVKVLTEDMKELTGGQVIINDDAKASADILEQIILEKRQGLQI